MLSGLEALVVHIRTQVLTGIVEFVSGVHIVNLGTFFVGPVVIATTKANTENETGQVNFKTADIVFLHTGCVIGRIVVVIVGNECPFREGQVAQLNRKEISRLVLNVGTIVNGGRISRFIVGFETNECRPLFVELDFKIQVEGRSIAVVQVIFCPDIACVSTSEVPSFMLALSMPRALPAASATSPGLVFSAGADSTVFSSAGAAATGVS